MIGFQGGNPQGLPGILPTTSDFERIVIGHSGPTDERGFRRICRCPSDVRQSALENKGPLVAHGDLRGEQRSCGSQNLDLEPARARDASPSRGHVVATVSAVHAEDETHDGCLSRPQRAGKAVGGAAYGVFEGGGGQIGLTVVIALFVCAQSIQPELCALSNAGSERSGIMYRARVHGMGSARRGDSGDLTPSPTNSSLI